MKYLKMLGLAALAAAALMAFVGAGTASGTVICKTEPIAGVCPAGWTYPVGTEGTATLEAGTSSLLETTGGELLVTCSESTAKSTLKEPGSAATTVKSGVSTLVFAKCTNMAVTLAGGSAELHWIPGTNNGTLTTIGTEVTVNILGVSCIYGSGAGLDVGTTVGGNPGSLTLNVVFPRIGGPFVCPATARYTGKYTATSPKNAWVAES
jgi:hypothetical protein